MLQAIKFSPGFERDRAPHFERSGLSISTGLMFP